MKDQLVEAQKKICSTYGSEFKPVLPEDIVGVAIETKDKEPIYGVRLNPDGNESGWYIWAGEHLDDADFYKPIHKAHLSDFFPLVEKYLGLAPGFKFIIDHNDYEDVWEESL